MKRLVIDRKRWLRGDPSNSFLLRSKDEKMCCLGFLALKCGYTEGDIDNKGLPSDVKDTSKFPSAIVKRKSWDDTNTSHKLMATNDDTTLEEPTRESRLKVLFKRVGYLVRFVE